MSDSAENPAEWVASSAEVELQERLKAHALMYPPGSDPFAGMPGADDELARPVAEDM